MMHPPDLPRCSLIAFAILGKEFDALKEDA